MIIKNPKPMDLRSMLLGSKEDSVNCRVFQTQMTSGQRFGVFFLPLNLGIELKICSVNAF